MVKKKVITKAIGANFYAAQRRDVGQYTSALIKVGYGDVRTFWLKLLERDHHLHIFRVVKVERQ